MAAYYNEIDPFAAAWLRELIAQGHIAPGDVDERSIEDVRPDDLRGYVQCHFFAGIGVWSYALRRAGWADDRPVWTGSCPCQPFSTAGKGGGFADERHLWPAFHWLIAARRPPVVFGEQVASKDGLAWLDLVQADLEGAGYAGRALDLCAAGVGAPHIRQRLWWVAEDGVAFPDNAAGTRRIRPVRYPESDSRDQARVCVSGSGGSAGELADSLCARLEGHGGDGDDRDQPGRVGTLAAGSAAEGGGVGRVADNSSARRGPDESRGDAGNRREEVRAGAPQPGRRCSAGIGHNGPGPTNGFWGAADWLFCRDEKWRPAEPGTFPLVDGAAARVGRLRGYGNAIAAEAARAFIEAYIEAREETAFLS